MAKQYVKKMGAAEFQNHIGHQVPKGVSPNGHIHEVQKLTEVCRVHFIGYI